ncbi:hypothetical protein Vretimale_168 [Volvox reticuliferus]|uniref:Uncharacterized protein n=1 Tax=Volvox reticuliferus TaxID=1737510 RepID=A0A8J4D827_9CHLO|nr:hypothetical protein Vretimale_168 [Volvox reticuliferus]
MAGVAVVMLKRQNADVDPGVEGAYSGLAAIDNTPDFGGFNVDVEPYPSVGTTADGGAAATTNAVSTPGLAPLGTPPPPPNTSSRGPTSPAVAAAAMTTPSQQPPPSDTVGQLPDSDLVMLMGELSREVSLEVELLVCIASSVELQTPAEELSVYDTMLKLQPYTDERIVVVALAQRDLLVPARSAAGNMEAPSSGQHGRGGGAASRGARREGRCMSLKRRLRQRYFAKIGTWTPNVQGVGVCIYVRVHICMYVHVYVRGPGVYAYTNICAALCLGVRLLGDV